MENSQQDNKLTPREALINVLNSDSIDIKLVRRLCRHNNLDSGGLRSRVWKPLTSKPTSDWSEYFRDNEALAQIDKDCRRLCPDFNFFHQNSQFPACDRYDQIALSGLLTKRVEASSLSSQSVDENLVGATSLVKMSGYNPFQETTGLSFGLTDHWGANLANSSCYSSVSKPGIEQHWEVIERILFIYYKTHSSQGYVQGMNEVVAPIYFVFATDPSDECKRHAEADTFFCFNNLMTMINPNFIRKLDGGQEAGMGESHDLVQAEYY